MGNRIRLGAAALLGLTLGIDRELHLVEIRLFPGQKRIRQPVERAGSQAAKANDRRSD